MAILNFRLPFKSSQFENNPRISHILSKISRGKGKRADFQSVFLECKNRIHAIVTFLAMLELINMQLVRITSGLGANNFWLEEVQEGDEEE